MELQFTDEEIAFRDEVRAFLKAELPEDIAGRVRRGEELPKDDYERWHAILNARGWLATIWPKEYGGPGWSVVERHIFEEECAMASAPRIVPFGITMLGPVLQKFGSKEQCDAILPRILNGDDWWCQGYSEPGAGSDLASLRTKAVREGDHYIVNGQKTWTTLGQHADRMFCLVRTDPNVKPQAGISFLLIDMDAPGVEVRPIKLIDGVHDVNDVFFTDVKVPVENLVGEENSGWTIAKFLLTHERTNIAGTGFSNQAFDTVRALARSRRVNGRRLIDDPLFAARLAQAEIDLEAMKITNLRMLARAQKTGQPGLESSMLKIKGTVIRQELNDLARRALGPAAAPFPAEALAGNDAIAPEDHRRNAGAYFNNRKLSIYGGSNEIQRNILTKAMLEL
ncbi:acyl-CoA dehydrogenase family protein [Acidimangrovimonas sediminis]|uniref:acyl-CoA dehydrogenase family protein n=1 Tax=Acidimangrovimonas sediminis TaxID=2056283 RepID=UPI000C7FA558|nr:acyl-CoA dehydrogenase family protein [Acidimangrovimonas sediminis]